LIDTLRAVLIEPAPREVPLQHLCLDQGYDYSFVEEVAQDLYIRRLATDFARLLIFVPEERKSRTNRRAKSQGDG
jgi:hypothetical protein